jgi:hypothetical protein
MDGNDPADLSHRASGTLGGPDKSRWTTGTALLGSVATANPSAEMPPQNNPWLGGRVGCEACLARVGPRGQPWANRERTTCA